jgi:hypothetical protein
MPSLEVDVVFPVLLARQLSRICLVVFACILAGCGIKISGPSGPSTSTNTNTASHSPTVSDQNTTAKKAESVATPTPEELAAAAAKRERADLVASRAELPVVDITFDDLKLDIGEDIQFDRSMLTDRVLELEGRRVVVRGYISGTVIQSKGITHFPLMRDTICKFGPGAQAHHNVQVVLAGGNATDFTTLPVAIEGILSIDPYEGPDELTYSIYKVVGRRAK